MFGNSWPEKFSFQIPALFSQFFMSLRLQPIHIGFRTYATKRIFSFKQPRIGRKRLDLQRSGHPDVLLFIFQHSATAFLRSQVISVEKTEQLEQQPPGKTTNVLHHQKQTDLRSEH